ncbi:hypothetical protein AB9_139 [Acinetobacter phage vB_AbaM_B9]|nr:hypothetical protein AB9_139 [Acinetobacter phage vB_AbaM_B9]
MQKIKTFENNFDFANTPLHEVKHKRINDDLHLLRFISVMFDEQIQSIILIMLDSSRTLFSQYDLCYLDVKVRNLKEGDSGDHLNQVHTDYVKDYNHPNKQETHLLYTNTGLTKFFDLVDGEYKLIGETEPNCVYKYNREYHQSPIVEKACKRVMIRLSFCDRLK